LDTLIAKVQAVIAGVLMILLIIVIALSTIHLCVLIAQEIWKPPRFLISVQDLLELFGYFLLVLIGVEILETLKGYFKKNTLHARVVLEVAMIAVARKVITTEPNAASGLTLLGIAALIVALGVAFYLESQARGKAEES
jgi:uncharacterized membrane protein (DUF373 family)